MRVAQFVPTVGTVVTTRVEFTDSGGSAADPGVVECEVGAPDGTSTVYSSPDVVRSAVGAYYLDFPVTDAGTWTVQWSGSGTGPNVVECQTFNVRAACL